MSDAVHVAALAPDQFTFIAIGVLLCVFVAGFLLTRSM